MRSQNVLSKLVFLVDPDVARREEAPLWGLSPFELLSREKDRFNDIIFFTESENSTFSWPTLLVSSYG